MKKKNIFDGEIIKAMGLKGLAKTKKRLLFKIDHLPPLALHDYVLIEKGATVGLVDDFWTVLDPLWVTPVRAKVYICDGNRFYLQIIDINDLTKIEKF